MAFEELSADLSALKPTLHSGVQFLLNQVDAGYSDAVHYLNLPRLTETSWEEICCPTDIFPRMLVLDSLIDAKDYDSRITKDLLEKEVQYVIDSKHQRVAGGWNYVPNFPELPPDADDLAFALQLLLRYKGAKAASLCDTAIQVLFANNVRNDGSFSTWIIDKNDNSESNRAVMRYTAFLFGEQALVPGGGGAHTDVIANLLYALLLYDNEKYGNELEKGAGYLESQQNPEGFWDSKWYWGPYYGTFKVIWFLQKYSKSRTIDSATKFVVNTQQEDGGWGETKESSDPLNTSLALLCLLGSSISSNISEKSLIRGFDYLKRSENDDGSWRNVRLVKMLTTRGTLLYGSRTATTSFCVKAFAAALGQVSR